MADELDAAPAEELDALDEAPVAEAPEPVLTPVLTPEPTAPKTMEESIREKYRELGSPKSDSDINRPRDAEGKFVAKPAESEVKPADVPKAEEKPAEPVVPEAVAPELAKAPTSWKGSAQAKWDKVDPEIRAEVHRREQDFHKGLELSKREAGLFKELDTVIQPYAAMLRADRTTPQVAIQNLLNTAYLMRTGSPEVKAATLAEIAQAYGVDIGELPAAAERLAAGTPVVDPQIAELRQQLATVTGSIEEQKQEVARREYAGIEAETRAFAAKNAHYEAVKLDMAALVESGRAADLQDAYDKAIWANPEVRGKLLAEQQATQRKLAADKAAAAKKAASANVVTRGTLPSAPVVGGTMEDTIRATLRKINGV